MTFTSSIKLLQKKNKALRKLVSDLEELNSKQFDELHKAQLRIQLLESENAYLRTLETKERNINERNRSIQQ